jgi:hypothetical protein
MFGSCLLGLGFHRDPLQVIKIRYKAKRGEKEEENNSAHRSGPYRLEKGKARQVVQDVHQVRLHSVHRNISRRVEQAVKESGASHLHTHTHPSSQCCLLQHWEMTKSNKSFRNTAVTVNQVAVVAAARLRVFFFNSF